MNKSNLCRHGGLRFRDVCVCVLGLGMALVVANATAIAQDSSNATPTPLTPPTPLEAGPTLPAVPATPNSQIIPPQSIGPAPGFYPPPAYFGFDGRPNYPAPVYRPAPMFGPPGYGPAPPFAPPGYYGSVPPQPLGPAVVPYGANFPPATPFLDQSSPRSNFETRRPNGPTGPVVSRPANFRLSVSEAFLNRIIAREDVKPGPVQDVILGAQVTGRQTTVTKLTLDLVPSAINAHAVFVLNGGVQSLTTGVTPQASIDTFGQQQFVATKDVFFDGEKLSTRHATVFIRANNKTIGAMTPLTGTLLGGLAERIAYRAAERQKEAGEAAARDRLADKLFPTFDGEVDAKLSLANRQLSSTVRKSLENVKLLPTSQSVWTTDTHFYHQALIGPIETQTLNPPESTEGQNGVQLSIHESLLNTLVDRAGLKGFKITDKELREFEGPYIPQALQDKTNRIDSSSDDDNDAVPLPVGTDKFVTDIVFDDVDPLVLRLEEDRLIVTMKATFKPGGQSLLPPMVLTIPYQIRIVGDKIRLTAGKPTVMARERANPKAPKTMVEATVEKLIQAELVPLEFDRKLPAELWTANGPAPQLTSIKSSDGWAIIGID